jgi:hypothetical protein
VKVSLSDREMVGLWDFMRGPIWGNTDETLLAQLELWDTLELETRFASLPASGAGPKLGDISAEPVEFELSQPAVTLLRSYLSRPAQPHVLGVISARALKRLG